MLNPSVNEEESAAYGRYVNSIVTPVPDLRNIDLLREGMQSLAISTIDAAPSDIREAGNYRKDPVYTPHDHAGKR